jgi:hypothetical protein
MIIRHDYCIVILGPINNFYHLLNNRRNVFVFNIEDYDVLKLILIYCFLYVKIVFIKMTALFIG